MNIKYFSILNNLKLFWDPTKNDVTKSSAQKNIAKHPFKGIFFEPFTLNAI